jgi:hypothetical protein
VAGGKDASLESDDTSTPTCEQSPYVFVTVEGHSACGIHEAGCISCWDGGGPFKHEFPPDHYQQVVLERPPLTRDGYEWIAWSSFLCALKEDGEIVCDGEFPYGELPTGPFHKIVAGTFHLCGLRVDGSIACVGDDYTGETQVPEGSYIDLVALYLRTCALTQAGKVVCWGDGSYWDNLPPIQLESGPFVSLYAEYSDICALRADGSASCSAVYSEPEWTRPPTIPLKQISLGSSYTVFWGMGLDLDGYAHPWPGFEEHFPAPTDVPFKMYAQGFQDGCGITMAGELHCYGDDLTDEDIP